MKRLQIPQKTLYEKFYVYEYMLRTQFAAINLSKTCSLKNAKETCQPNNRHLNHDWIKTTFIPISEAVTGS